MESTSFIKKKKKKNLTRSTDLLHWQERSEKLASSKAIVSTSVPTRRQANNLPKVLPLRNRHFNKQEGSKRPKVSSKGYVGCPYTGIVVRRKLCDEGHPFPIKGSEETRSWLSNTGADGHSGEKVTSICKNDRWFQNTLSQIYQIYFFRQPSICKAYANTRLSLYHTSGEYVLEEVNSLLEKDAVESVSQSVYYLGLYFNFCDPKEGHRQKDDLILNVKPLNKFLRRTWFKMQAVHSISCKD